jgi:hypothetical protein
MSKTNDKSFPGQLAEAAGPQFTGEVNSPSTSPAFEPYVPPEVVADFLAVKRREILQWARAGLIPAHPLGHGKRRTWRFRLSDVNAAVLSWTRPTRPIIPSGSPPVARKRGDANG